MKKLISFLLKLLISGTLLFIFISRVDIEAVKETISHTKIPIFIAGFFVYLSTIFVSTKRWSLFLPPGMKYFKLVSMYFIGSFFNTFLPGLVGGDAVKAFYLYRHIGKGGLSLATVFMDRYMGLVALSSISLIAYAGGFSYVQDTQLAWVIPLFFSLIIAGSIFLWKINWGRIGLLKSFYEPLMSYKNKRNVIYKGLLLGFIVQTIGITSVLVLSRAIGLETPFIYFFMFIPLVAAASAIPVSIAGLGIREAGFVILFTKAGVTAESALSLSLVSFSVMCMANLIGGVEYLRMGKPLERNSDFNK
jgi:hypothetical protein